jgi:hypothetical protein
MFVPLARECAARNSFPAHGAKTPARFVLTQFSSSILARCFLSCHVISRLGVPRPVHHSAFSQFAQAPLTAWFGPIQFCLAALDSTVTDRPQRLQPWSACKSPCPRFCLVCSSFSAGFGSVAGQLLGTSSSSRLRFSFMFLLLILPV